MNPEYVRISSLESSYGQRELLESQLKLLNILSILKRYRNCRNEEIAIRVLLRTKIEEAKESIEVLEKMLPKPSIKENERGLPEEKIEKDRYTLESEIEEIKRKLEKLSSWH